MININIDKFKNLIDFTEDKSDERMDRLKITFQNGYGLSIINGEYSYGGDKGLYEIAPYNKEGKMDGRLLDGEDNDDVLGYLQAPEVEYYIKKIGDL